MPCDASNRTITKQTAKDHTGRHICRPVFCPSLFIINIYSQPAVRAVNNPSFEMLRNIHMNKPFTFGARHTMTLIFPILARNAFEFFVRQCIFVRAVTLVAHNYDSSPKNTVSVFILRHMFYTVVTHSVPFIIQAICRQRIYRLNSCQNS